MAEIVVGLLLAGSEVMVAGAVSARWATLDVCRGREEKGGMVCTLLGLKPERATKRIM